MSVSPYLMLQTQAILFWILEGTRNLGRVWVFPDSPVGTVNRFGMY